VVDMKRTLPAPEPAVAPMSDETDDARGSVDLLRELEAFAYERGKLDAMIQLARDPDVTVRLADKGNTLADDIREAEQRILRRLRAAGGRAGLAMRLLEDMEFNAAHGDEYASEAIQEARNVIAAAQEGPTDGE
jgi:hypothetical protein